MSKFARACGTVDGPILSVTKTRTIQCLCKSGCPSSILIEAPAVYLEQQDTRLRLSHSSWGSAVSILLVSQLWSSVLIFLCVTMPLSSMTPAQDTVMADACFQQTRNHHQHSRANEPCFWVVLLLRSAWRKRTRHHAERDSSRSSCYSGAGCESCNSGTATQHVCLAALHT
jgi:hypothetical protein